MRRWMLVVASVVLVFVAAFAAWFTLRPKDASATRASMVLKRAESAQGRILADLGPNSTLHMIAESYAAPATDSTPPGDRLPARTIGEEWITFDANGNLSSYSASIRGASDGRLYQLTTYSGGRETITDELTGISRSSASFTLTPDGIRNNYSNALNAELAAQPSAADAPVQTYQGHPVYVISGQRADGTVESVYIDASTYQAVHGQTIDASGNVIDSTDTKVFAVLTPGVTPTPESTEPAATTTVGSSTVAAPAASATPTP